MKQSLLVLASLFASVQSDEHVWRMTRDTKAVGTKEAFAAEKTFDSDKSQFKQIQEKEQNLEQEKRAHLD